MKTKVYKEKLIINNMKKIENKVTKLCNEYSRKIMREKNEIKILLIDFAREYNKIWEGASCIKKANNEVEDEM